MRTFKTIGVVILLAAGFTITAAGTRLTVRSTTNHDLIISVDPVLHQRFGISYPITYIITYGAGHDDLQAYVRHDSTSGWTLLPAKDPDDHFNGIDAVRFDEATHTAYVSTTFSASSDDIHIRISEQGGEGVPTAFAGVARYYDNRDAAVVVSTDDWKDYTDSMFTRVASILRSYHLPYTTAVITGETTESTWAHIQAELDAGGAEAASHTRTHSRWPYEDIENQVAGSRLDLLDNLTMPAQFRKGETEYVYSFLVPFGETSAEIETTVTHAGYLNCRVVNFQNGDFTPWDTLMERFPYDGTTMEMGSPWGSTDPVELNAAFDQRLSTHGIYHLLLHPYTLVPSGEIYSEFFADHLSHISDRKNIWYTTFGHLYVYRLMGDSTVGITHWPSAPPVITANPTSQWADEGSDVLFRCLATGSEPLAFQWQRDDVDLAGATASTLTLSSVIRADSGASFRCIVQNPYGADTSAPAILSVIPTGSGSGIVSDDFNAVGLDTLLWDVVNALDGATIGVTGGGTDDARLVIALPAGTAHDLWAGTNNAPRVMQATADGDLSIVVKFDGAMTSSIQTQGVVFEEDSANFIRFDLVYDAPDLVFFAATFSEGVPTEQANVPLTLQAPSYLRVGRIGDTWTGMYSADGSTWTTATSFTHPMHVRRVGPWAGNAGASAPAFTSQVDYFMNTHAPIVGEDGTDILTAPSITTDPSTVTVSEGGAASFSIEVTGAAPLSYRWQRNGVDTPGGTSTTFTLSGVARADSGAQFRCIASNGFGRDTSATVVLHVIKEPSPPPFVLLAVHLFLEGAMATDSMRTDLCDHGLLPHAQPFCAMGYTDAEGDSLDVAPPAAVDWVLVELRGGTADSTVRARHAGLVMRNGAVTEIDGISPLRFEGLTSGNYYIVVRHRNHLPSMSAVPIAMDSAAVTYDFRSAASQSYGGSAVSLTCGKFAMIGGSVDRNRGIGATDLARVRQAMPSGPAYLDADCNMDGTVTASDLSLTRGNIGRVAGIP